jgi:hypothetical protein
LEGAMASVSGAAGGTFTVLAGKPLPR